MGLRNVLSIWFKGYVVNSVGFQGMLGFNDVHARGFRGVEGLQRCTYSTMRFQGVLDFSDVHFQEVLDFTGACDTIFSGCRVTARGLHRDVVYLC